VIWNHQKIKKRVRPQNTIFSADQSAIITAIIHSTMKKTGRKLIATDSLSISTMVAASDKKDTKKPKTQTIWKLLGQEVDKITLLWVPSHVGIPKNEEAENAARDELDENLDNTLSY
jgi:ribonuclease HI